MPSNKVFQYSKIPTQKRRAKKRIKTGKKWNPPLFGIRNPLSWNPESSTRNPESTAWNPKSKTVLDSLTWGEKLIKSEKNGVTGALSTTYSHENSDVTKIRRYILFKKFQCCN